MIIAPQVKTCEFVSPKHPDKTCDLIVDTLLDAYLVEDPASRVALEALGGHGLITVTGEVTSRARVNIAKIVQGMVRERYKVTVRVSEQSPEIGRGVDTGGAGDQGIMVGYTTAETETMMPKEYELARNLCNAIYERFPFDGKVQVTIEGERIKSAVASFQNTKNAELGALVKSLIKSDRYFINAAGEWTVGGFDADSGLSGRKIVIDSYGPQVPVGGGSFSGKDPTKVDRSGAYMARKIAVDYLKKYKAGEVLVKLAYVIGVAQPVMAMALVDGKAMNVKDYDLTPQAIIKTLGLAKPIYAQTATGGHFGRGFAWDK